MALLKTYQPSRVIRFPYLTILLSTAFLIVLLSMLGLMHWGGDLLMTFIRIGRIRRAASGQPHLRGDHAVVLDDSSVPRHEAPGPVGRGAAAVQAMSDDQLRTAVRSQSPINRLQCGQWTMEYSKLHRDILSGRAPQRYKVV